MSASPQVDWFVQNAPPATPSAPSATSADWFAQNAPTTSPSGGQNPAAPAAPTAPKVSDFVPDWQTPGKVARGVGEGLYGIGKGLLQTAMHPITAIEGIGGGLEKIKNDIKERQYIGALADTVNLTGFDEQKAAQMWSAGKGAEAVGQAVPSAVADAFMIEGIPKTIAAAKNGILASPAIIKSIATPAGRRALLDSASAVRDTMAARTQQILHASSDAAASHVSRLVRGINEADEADIATKGLAKSGIDTRPMTKGLNEAQGIYRQIGQKMPGADLVAKRLSDLGGTRVPFEMAKQLRTDVGAAMEHATGAQKAILASTYGDLSDAMAARADDLGLSKQFDAYNKIHSVLQDYQKHGLLGKLLDAKDSGQFYDEIGKRGNRASIIKLQNTLADYGLQPDTLDASFADVKDLHKYLQSGTAGSFIGVFRKLAEHPVGGGLGLLAGSAAGNYMTRIFGAWAGAALAERIAVVRALEKMGIDVPAATGSEMGAASKVAPKGGASIGEQLAAKGQAPPKVSGTEDVMSARRAEMQTSASKLGPEFAEGERQHLITQYKKVLQNPGATAEEKSIATSQLADLTESEQNPAPSTGRGEAVAPVEQFPVKVTMDEQGNITGADGRHRIIAAIQRGDKTIPVQTTLRDGTTQTLNVDPNKVAKAIGVTKESLAATDEQNSAQHQGTLARLTPDQVDEVGKSLGVSDEDKETVNRQNRVKETVQVSKRIEKGERELERLEKMKDHIGPSRYEEAVAEISKMLDTLRAQVEH